MWKAGQHHFEQHLILGTAQYPSLESLKQAIILSKTELVTVSMRRERISQTSQNEFCDLLKELNVKLLPNTAGCQSAKEAIQMAEIAREVFQTDLIKLEISQEQTYLTPNGTALIEAANELIRTGMTVMPFCTEDLSIASHLVDIGCQVLMPWASPIGSGQGLLNQTALLRLRHHFPDTCLIVDAGLARPSEAAAVMEMGYDAILINSAVARCQAPASMASAFASATKAGRAAYQAGIIGSWLEAVPSTASLDEPFWRSLQLDRQC